MRAIPSEKSRGGEAMGFLRGDCRRRERILGSVLDARSGKEWDLSRRMAASTRRRGRSGVVDRVGEALE